MGCDEISADWAAQRIKGLSLATAIVDALKRSIPLLGGSKPNDGMAVKTLLESFRYPRLGPGMLWDAARDRILERGGAICMGCEPAQLSHNPTTGRWRIVVRDADGFLQTVSARHVISSIPMRDLAGKIYPLPQNTSRALDLKYRDFLTVALMMRADNVFPDNWIYVHDPKVKVGRIQNFRSWSPHMVPDPSVCCVGLEYFCFEGDGLWSSSDADLIALAKSEMASLGLASPEEIFMGCVVRQEKPYSVYDEAYRENVDLLRSELEAGYPTLHLVGRNGMHKYNNQDHAMMTAMLTARNIIAGERLYDVWKVNEDAEYHESGIEGANAALESERLVPRRVA